MIHCQASPLGILYTPRGVEAMTKLEERLNSIPGAYFAFVHGISKYASKKPERYDAVMNYLDEYPDSTPSDITLFVMEQPDFFEDDVRYSGNQLAQM